MDISYSKEAQRAFNSSPKVIQHYANSLLASYAQYANRHSLPGKSTLSNISKTARSLLNLPPGTVIFVRKEKSVPRGTNPAPRIGTAHPKRKSEATKKTPTKRLVARRKRNTKAGYYPNPIQDKIALYFNAGNDTNGNPRRLFVVVNTAGAVIGAYDEGYAGESAVTKHYPGIAIVGRFDITPAQRKSLLKEYGK